jgi:predicted enzyme related to lactoylglutathione lyase
MIEFSLVLLYVDNPAASAAFYQRLLGTEPVQISPAFAMFALREDVMLGLWSRHVAEPAAPASVGGAEIIFNAPDRDSVKAAYAEWMKQGLRVAQTPREVEFGFTFTALDPDGHRLRVLAPNPG